jgi:hypothetical protein
MLPKLPTLRFGARVTLELSCGKARRRGGPSAELKREANPAQRASRARGPLFCRA